MKIYLEVIMEVYKVGGCVRDTIMGLTPNDIDYVVVGSNPQEMLDNGFTLVGASFPVFLDENGDEYALARTERKSGKGYSGRIVEYDIDATLENGIVVKCLDGKLLQKFINSGVIIDKEYAIDDLMELLRHICQ